MLDDLICFSNEKLENSYFSEIVEWNSPVLISSLVDDIQVYLLHHNASTEI